jgi:hypothetical protein
MTLRFDHDGRPISPGALGQGFEVGLYTIALAALLLRYP